MFHAGIVAEVFRTDLQSAQVCCRLPAPWSADSLHRSLDLVFKTMAGAGRGPCAAVKLLLAASLVAALLVAPAAGAVCKETNNEDALFGTAVMDMAAEIPSPDGGLLVCLVRLPLSACHASSQQAQTELEIEPPWYLCRKISPQR